MLNIENGVFDLLTHSTENKKGLLDDAIRGMYGNGQGIVWVTYENRGITKINANLNNFKYIKASQESNSTTGNNVRAVFKDSQEALWLGTYNHGLFCVRGHRYDQSFHYRHDPKDINSISSNYITAIYKDRENRLWVGTFEDGFCYADLSSDNLPIKFIRSEFDKKIEIHEFTEDPYGRIWISTNYGFYIFDKSQDKLFHYGDHSLQIKGVKRINIQSVVFEAPNIFWLGTWNSGVAKLMINSDSLLSQSQHNDQIIIYDQNQIAPGGTIDNRLINIMKDQNGNFWLSSNVNGLIKMNIQNGKAFFKKYDKTQGSPSNSIYGVVEDEKGDIWLSSKQGLAKFIPKTEQFINFYASDGLQSNTFIWDSYFQSEDGEIFFGGINGVNAFYPDSIFYDKTSPKPYLKELIINHKPVRIGEKVHGNILLNQNIRYIDELVLTNREPIFSLEFAALNIQNPKEVQFEYMLENFDEGWITTSSENRIATYTNLPRGTYYFKVRATRNYGIWQEPLVLKVIVLPPWWKTHLAYIIYFISFLVLVYFIKQELSKRIQLKHNLALELYKHERDNELNREKFQFFTDLSHELRTPLTLILGPLDRMIRKSETNGRTHQNLLLIQKQALKLQKLTNQLLKFRKFDVKNIKLKTAEGNIVKFLNEIEIAFRQHAKIKEIKFKLSSQEENIPLFWDRDKLEIVIVNMLSNAFKFTPPQGKVALKCKAINVKDFYKTLGQLETQEASTFGELPNQITQLVEIAVQDTGCGIKPEQLRHIFDRYFQASNTQSFFVEGTGIGLEIAKNYIELHKGVIGVLSKEAEGTTFYIWLPQGKQHLAKSEIIKDFKPSEHRDHYLPPEIADPKQLYPELLFNPEEKEQFQEDLSTLLIVDDNPDIVHFLKESFRKNYNLITASNGKDALDKAIQHIPDLIISDIMMPEIDGLELCNTLKSDVRTSHIPVILLTARTSTVFQVQGLETGADDYVTKPFDEHILNVRVKNLITSRKLLHQKYQKELILKPKDVTITQPDEQFLYKLLEIVEANISDSNLKIGKIAKEIGMSHSVLYKKVQALTGLTVVEFIRSTRLKKAALIFPNLLSLSIK